MSSDNDELPGNEKREDEQVDWDSILYQQDHKIEEAALGKTDYVALFIASIETIFLPLIILGALLVILSLLFLFWI